MFLCSKSNIQTATLNRKAVGNSRLCEQVGSIPAATDFDWDLHCRTMHHVERLVPFSAQWEIRLCVLWKLSHRSIDSVMLKLKLKAK